MPAAATGERGTSPDEVGLREAADRLDVHYMTAYRYVRSGRLPAHKVGDEWRVRLDDLERLARPQAPAAAATSGARARQVHRDRLEARLVAGDEAGAWAVVDGALAAGAAPSEVLTDVLVPCLRSIGERWSSGSLAIADEHRASAVATRLVARLGPRFAQPGRRRGTVVLGSVAGDRHHLPTAIMADLLRGARLDVVDLGADTPAESFVDAARGATRLVAVGVCVSSPEVLRSVPPTVRALHRARLGAPVVVGGGAVPDGAAAASLGADEFASGPDEVVALFARLAAART